MLEAAHIRPYAQGGQHRVENGLLLRSDLHTLFDRGEERDPRCKSRVRAPCGRSGRRPDREYVTVTPDLHVEVSRRIRDDFHNGRDYYALHRHPIREPADPAQRPDATSLQWHNEEAFLG